MTPPPLTDAACYRLMEQAEDGLVERIARAMQEENAMNAKTLPEAMRAAAARIEAKDGYEWQLTDCCNCGILAQCVMGVNEDELRDARGLLIGTWEMMSKHVCRSSGLPMPVVFQVLCDSGMSLDDFDHLEWLSCRAIRKRAGLTLRKPNTNSRGYDDFDEPIAVASYLRAFASIVEERQAAAREPELAEALS